MSAAKPSAAIAENRAARHHYQLGDEYVAGVVLTGAEAKACRAENVSLRGAFVAVDARGEAWLKGADIPPYRFARSVPHDRLRDRKLLLHARELAALARELKVGGVTAVPLNLHFSRGKVKLRLAIGRGKKLWDKRAAQKERDLRRAAARGDL